MLWLLLIISLASPWIAKYIWALKIDYAISDRIENKILSWLPKT